MARRMTAKQRRYFGKRRRSTALVRRSGSAVVVRPVVVGAGKRRSGRRGRRRMASGTVTGSLKEYAWEFAASAGYGYIREGGTQNFNEFMDKVPGGDYLGKDLRNALVFWAIDRYAVKSTILRRLASAAVNRSGYTFGRNKFSKLEGDGGNEDGNY